MSYTPVDPPAPGLPFGLGVGIGLALALAGLLALSLSVNFFLGGGGAIEAPLTEPDAGGLLLKLVMLFGGCDGGAARLVSEGGGLPANPVGDAAAVGVKPPENGEEAGASPE